MKNKIRVKKSVTKRFKITKTGKVLHRGHGARHLRSNKSNKQLRSLAIPREVVGKQKVKIKRMLGI